MTNPISRNPIPTLDELPGNVRDCILEVQEKTSFIPNIFLGLAHRSDEFRAFVAYHDALMGKESGLSEAEREMIMVATSNANQCQYCVVAHGAPSCGFEPRTLDRRSGGDQLSQGRSDAAANRHPRFRLEGFPSSLRGQRRRFRNAVGIRFYRCGHLGYQGGRGVFRHVQPIGEHDQLAA